MLKWQPKAAEHFRILATAGWLLCWKMEPWRRVQNCRSWKWYCECARSWQSGGKSISLINVSLRCGAFMGHFSPNTEVMFELCNCRTLKGSHIEENNLPLKWWLFKCGWSPVLNFIEKMTDHEARALSLLLHDETSLFPSIYLCKGYHTLKKPNILFVLSDEDNTGSTVIWNERTSVGRSRFWKVF